MGQSLHPECGQFFPVTFLHTAVAGQAAPLLALHNRPLGTRAADAGPVVLELDLTRQPLVLPADPAGGEEREVRTRGDLDLVEPQLLGQREPGQLGHVEQAIDQGLAIFAGHLERTIGGQQVGPAERAAIVKPGDTLGEDHQPPGQQQPRVGERTPLVVPLQLTAHLPAVFGFVRSDVEAQFPAPGFVEHEALGLFGNRPGQPQSTGGAQLGNQHQRQVESDLELGLLSLVWADRGVPDGAIHRDPDQLGQQPTVLVVVDLFQPARLDPQRLELPPLPVRAPLPLHDLQDQGPAFPARHGIDLVKDLAIAGSDRGLDDLGVEPL